MLNIYYIYKQRNPKIMNIWFRKDLLESLNVCSSSHFIDEQNKLINLVQAHDFRLKWNTDQQE